MINRSKSQLAILFVHLFVCCCFCCVVGGAFDTVVVVCVLFFKGSDMHCVVYSRCATWYLK